MKYELDKRTGLIKVMMCAKPFLLFSLYVNRFLNVQKCAGWPCAVLISCVPAQLWLHSSYSLWGQWSHGCLNYHAGMHIPVAIVKISLFLFMHVSELYIPLKALSRLTSLFVQGIQTWVALTTIGVCTTCVCCNRRMYINAFVFMSVSAYVNCIEPEWWT